MSKLLNLMKMMNLIIRVMMIKTTMMITRKVSKMILRWIKMIINY